MTPDAMHHLIHYWAGQIFALAMTGFCALIAVAVVEPGGQPPR